KAARQSHNVPRQHRGDHLALAIAQQLVSGCVPALDEAKLTILVSIDDEVAPAFDGGFDLNEIVEALQIGGRKITQLAEAENERVLVAHASIDALSSEFIHASSRLADLVSPVGGSKLHRRMQCKSLILSNAGD